MTRSPTRLPALNGLRAFEASARHLNFHRAAEELGVTQGAVAQQVRALEADLGVRLFERLPRGLALTDAGRGYAAQVGRAFALMTEATALLRPGPRYVTVSVFPTFAAKWLIPRLPAFAAAHPGIDVRIIASSALADFGTDGVDIAVRQGRPPPRAALAVDLLFEQELVAVGSSALIARLGAPLDPDSLGTYPLLHDAHDLWPSFAERALGTAPEGATRGSRFNQTSLAIDAAVAGQGLALVPRALVVGDLEAGRLSLAFDATIRGEADFYIVMPRRSRRNREVAAVRDWLLASASSEARAEAHGQRQSRE
jgi:LysR family glycine cleavage system transcriptional activator